MKPYWQSADGSIVIYHGDMRELCASLRADAVVTDAPFGIADAPLGARKGGRKGDTAPTPYHAPSEWDRDLDPEWCRAACEAAPVVAWFGSWKRRADVEAAMSYPIRCEVVWAKDCHVGPPCPAAMRDERIWIFGPVGITPQRFETSVWEVPMIPTWAHKSHKNEKPIRLMTRLLSWMPSGLVADPFMGSGSTLRAAKDLGRKAIGIELEERYCEIAAKRLAQEVLFPAEGAA